MKQIQKQLLTVAILSIMVIGAYWSGILKARFDTKTKLKTTQVYYISSRKTDDALLQVLENRNGKIIIEVNIGTVDDEKGNGTDIGNHYIKYDNAKFSKGDKIQSVFIYNPDNNYIDDILYRIDMRIK